ncbi:MAG: hypothetical protein IJ711_05040 [Lachnospiraceae bacterium]|nr:hypothetical protein [Lachnospiraceae bacterium]
MAETYVEYIRELIITKTIGAPIYSADMANQMEKKYHISQREASANTAVAVKRIMDRGLLPELRCYQKGIYFRTADTPFGETGIDKEQLIADRYIVHDNGYDGGFRLLYQMGLTTQIPADRVVVTNKAGKGMRKDRKLEISICPPHTKITTDNKEYLKVLDVLEIMQKAPIDADAPYRMLFFHIRKMELDFGKLMAYAALYYNRNTLTNLAKVAVEGGIADETA